MFFRCPQCAGNTLVKPESVDPSVPLACGRCRAEHDVPNFHTLGATEREHYEKANEIATVCDVDLPSAYSILLGMLTLKDAQRLAGEGPPPDPKPAEQRAAGFRSESAPPPLPERRKVRRVELPAPRERRRRTAPWIVSLAVLCLVFATTTVVLWTELSRLGQAPVERPLPLPSAEVRTDRAGRVVRVVGPDPQTVLAAFCKIDATDTPYEPVEIFIAAEPGLRFGIVTDPSVPGSRFAIRIRREDSVNSWAAGDGERGIPLEDSPPIPKGTATIPVNWKR